MHETKIIVEPRQVIKDKYNLFIGRTLGYIDTGQVPVLILNPSNAPIKLYKGTVVGVAEECSAFEQIFALPFEASSSPSTIQKSRTIFL